MLCFFAAEGARIPVTRISRNSLFLLKTLRRTGHSRPFQTDRKHPGSSPESRYCRFWALRATLFQRNRKENKAFRVFGVVRPRDTQ